MSAAWEQPGLTVEERARAVWSERSELQADITAALRAAVREAVGREAERIASVADTYRSRLEERSTPKDSDAMVAMNRGFCTAFMLIAAEAREPSPEFPRARADGGGE